MLSLVCDFRSSGEISLFENRLPFPPTPSNNSSIEIYVFFFCFVHAPMLFARCAIESRAYFLWNRCSLRWQCQLSYFHSRKRRRRRRLFRYQRDSWRDIASLTSFARLTLFLFHPRSLLVADCNESFVCENVNLNAKAFSNNNNNNNESMVSIGNGSIWI